MSDNNTREKLLRALRFGDTLTMGQLRERTNSCSSSLLVHLRELQIEGVVERVGAKSRSRYKLAGRQAE